MPLLLAGDIGGTKTILRLVQTTTTNHLETVHEARYASADFPDLVPIVQQFLADAAKAQAESSLVPQRACFAIAGPVVNHTSQLTNLGWTLERDRLRESLHIPQVALINDFMAIGYGVRGLAAADLHPLQTGSPDPQAPVAVIGAGTGLGQGFLVPQGDRDRVFPSEGGHADFAPRSELEFQLLHYLREKHQIGRVSVERVVSGQGIVSLYQFLRDRQVAPESPDVQTAIQTWERQIGQPEKTVDPGAVIGEAALAGRDRLCEQAMQLFVSAYGAEAGNLALKLLPYGGLYVAGGIATKILPLLRDGTFMQAFHDKGRLRPVMEDIPVYVVLNAQVGLLGAARYAAYAAPDPSE